MTQGPITTRRVTAAAVKLEDGSTFSLPPPARHHHLLRKSGEIVPPERQGFVDDLGRFLSREQARKIAVQAGQIKGKPSHAAQLFSEDVW